ncbi:putative mannose-specific lectin precursor [Longispora fulva]|nr:putative mannose-specific lectin precursor [Longispora fulva]
MAGVDVRRGDDLHGTVRAGGDREEAELPTGGLIRPFYPDARTLPRDRYIGERDQMDTLKSGDSLGVEQKLTSNNGKHALRLQGDGNLVLYTDADVAWSSGTEGKNAVRAELQGDGNFVLYTSDNTAVWATGTSGSDTTLTLRNDRELVLSGGDGTVLWTSNTSNGEPLEEPSAAPAPAAPAAAAARTYTVQSGDTLWGIAEQFYGDGNRYMEIANANGISNPDLINPGQVLTIP